MSVNWQKKFRPSTQIKAQMLNWEFGKTRSPKLTFAKSNHASSPVMPIFTGSVPPDAAAEGWFAYCVTISLFRNVIYRLLISQLNTVSHMMIYGLDRDKDTTLQSEINNRFWGRFYYAEFIASLIRNLKIYFPVYFNGFFIFLIDILQVHTCMTYIVCAIKHPWSLLT